MTDKEKPMRSAGGQLTAARTYGCVTYMNSRDVSFFWVSESNQLDVATFLFFFFYFFAFITSKISTYSNNAPFGHSGMQESAHAGDPSVQHQHGGRPSVSPVFIFPLTSPCVCGTHGMPYLYSRERLTLTAHLYSRCLNTSGTLD